MKYNEFIDTLIQELTPLFPSDTSITCEPIEKNNGVFWDAILIREKNQYFSPTIYTKPLFEQFTKGMALSTIVSDIYHIYRKNQNNPPINFEMILSGDEIKQHLSIQLVSYNQNIERLKNCPHIRYLDLAIVFFCRLQLSDLSEGTFLVRQEHLKLWNLSFDELQELAFANMVSKDPAQILPIQELLKQIVETDIEISDLFPPNFFEHDTLFYVLSNVSRSYGASAILYPDVLEQFSDQIDNSFYLIPSSVHEMLLLPENDSYSVNELSQMLHDVNNTQLSETEILSYNIYYYSKENKALSQITDN